VKAAFAKALEGLQPFEIRFSRFKAFERGTSSTIYLEPEVEPSNALADLYGILTRVLPPSSSAAPFEPHIGIGYFKNIREAAELQKKYQAGWKPIKFLAKEIYFLSRSSQDDPWQVQAVVPLGGGRSTDRPYFEIGETTDSK
jgi:2'-5' RNA ligase